MKLISIVPDLSLDFYPLTNWPEVLPVICSSENQLITGFERFRNQELKHTTVLWLNKTSKELLLSIYNQTEMSGFEFLRFNHKIHISIDDSYSELLLWPMAFQIYCDQKKLPLKSLKPLTYVSQFRNQLAQCILELKPTSSQLREIIELTCDLVLNFNCNWESLSPSNLNPQEWLTKLQNLRFPLTSKANTDAKHEIKQVIWPKGVFAKWEKQGDQAALVIQSKIYSHTQWEKLQKQLLEIQLSESTWKI